MKKMKMNNKGMSADEDDNDDLDDIGNLIERNLKENQ